MKRCEDCKWCKFNSVNPEFSTCHAPQNIDHNKIRAENAISKVVVNIPYKFNFCKVHRESPFLESIFSGTCGYRGRWWTPK